MIGQLEGKTNDIDNSLRDHTAHMDEALMNIGMKQKQMKGEL